MTKARALIYFEPHSSEAERTKHEDFDMLTYREKSPNPVRGSFKNISYPLNIDCFLWWLIASSNLQANQCLLFQINFDVYLKSILV